jgi:hypothetical protein
MNSSIVAKAIFSTDVEPEPVTTPLLIVSPVAASGVVFRVSPVVSSVLQPVIPTRLKTITNANNILKFFILTLHECVINLLCICFTHLRYHPVVKTLFAEC